VPRCTHRRSTSARSSAGDLTQEAMAPKLELLKKSLKALEQ
jgi:DNA-binding XRE family transcriptional regulator